jgi:2-methylcitrate dehydratase PrpD
MANASTCIISFAARFRDYDPTTVQRHLAYRAFLDTYACAIAGRNEEAPRIAHDYMKAGASAGKATAWATGERMRPEDAAWVNAITTHVLDYDDVMTVMRGHVSAALVPALVAVGQQIGATGRDYARAYVAGFELLAKLSPVMAVPHYAKGWHSTSALGVLGGTVACCTLLKLDERSIASALGLAIAQAGGTRENFGTMGKSFQAGEGAGASARASLLAQAGYTGGAEAFDGAAGYLTLYGNREDAAPAMATLGQGQLAIETIGIDVKKYPCCYATHRVLDAVLALRKEHGVTLDAVDRVEVACSPHGLEAVIYDRPTNGLEGKFSVEYTVAAALKDGEIRFSSFDDAAVMRPEIQAFLPRITKHEEAGALMPRWMEGKLWLKNGKTLAKRVVIARGDAGDPLSDDELAAKADDCFSYAGVRKSGRELAARVYALDDLKFDDLLAL